MTTNDDIRTEVRDHYSAVARGQRPACCGGGDAEAASAKLGYSADELAAPGNLGLGCGNPQAIAQLRPGETAIDLGAGGGFDCFLAARAVGATGRVIGIDASADMVSLSRANAERHGATNVEFRLGEIEHLPIADASVDVVISNCVINLSPDKPAVYREAFRVLREGGRLAISDVVATRPLPPGLAKEVAALCGCISGAAPIDELRALLVRIGFREVRVELDESSRAVIAGWAPGRGFEDHVVSARITAVRGTAACCPPGCCA